MRSHSQVEIFTEREVQLLIDAAAIVKEIPDESDRGPVRCHEVARIVGALLKLEVQDGYYGFVDHSWLWTTPLKKTHVTGRLGMPNVLDVYCVGSLPQVRLLDSSVPSLPHIGWAYRPGQERSDIDIEFVDSIALLISCKVRPSIPPEYNRRNYEEKQ